MKSQNQDLRANPSWGIRDDHYSVCRLDIQQDSEFATGNGYPKSAFLELCFGGLSPPNSPVATGLCGKTSDCFPMQLTYKSSWVTWYVKLARYVKLSVYEHDKVQSGTTHSGSIYSASWRKTCAGTILPSFEHK